MNEIRLRDRPIRDAWRVIIIDFISNTLIVLASGQEGS